MKSLNFIVFISFFLSISGCREQTKEQGSPVIIGSGQMPDMESDTHDNVYIVYGSGDSIMYSSSPDQGKTFTVPDLIAILPELAASHMRGPQIAYSKNGVSIIACNKTGNIYSYHREISGKWSKGVKVNDVDGVAKEGLMTINAGGEFMYAAWLDLRDKHNKIFGAASNDGGKSWAKDQLIYASPDSTVCECCKPSVVVRGNKVTVMFRNWLHGNRDMYIIRSTDGGVSFGQVQKLGNGNWPLNGCPMDGGGLSVLDNNAIQTVWNRKGKIFSCEPGYPEKEIGEGKECRITIIKINRYTRGQKIVKLFVHCQVRAEK
jgi:hypothetical protein